MGKFSYVMYNNAYSIGDIDSNEKITGFGYTYFTDTRKQCMGPFVSDKFNGWVCYIDQNKDGDTVYLTKYKNDKNISGLNISSSDEFLDFSENIDGGKCIGYSLAIWDDGCWRYEYNNGKEKHESKAVQFYPEYNGLYMTYRADNKNEWEKHIGKGKIVDFTIPFHRFKQKAFPNVEIVSDENCVWSKPAGPIVIYQPNIDSTTISFLEDEKYNGIWYWDQKDTVQLTQLVDSKKHGGQITVYKKTNDYKYTYFNNDTQDKIEVLWFRDTCTLEIRKYCYGNFEYFDMIQIDKDFNVWFAKKWNIKKQKAEYNLNYDWDQEYSGNETSEDVVEDKTKKTLTKKTTKTKNIEKEDWTEKFRDLFK